MHYEVSLGEHYAIVEAGNIWQACILCLQLLPDHVSITSVFVVRRLGSGDFDSDGETVELTEILKILELSADFTGVPINLAEGVSV